MKKISIGKVKEKSEFLSVRKGGNLDLIERCSNFI